MIKGAKIAVRSLHTSDAMEIMEWENNESLWRYSDRNTAFTLMEIEAHIRAMKEVGKTKQLRLMIVTPDQEKIGLVDIFDMDFEHQRGALGILIANKEHRRQGYASEALRLMMKFAHLNYGITNFYCTIQSDNIHSIALFEKLQFTRTGERKEWYKIDGKWINEYFYQRIIKKDET
jgi:diamine N-acetyltransferase